MPSCAHCSRKSRCVTCHGSEICQHNTRRTRCVLCKDVCGPSSEICTHNQRKSRCVQCALTKKGGVKEICQHLKRRSRCVECGADNGATEICPHKRRRSRCVECNGVEMCPHKKRKIACVECYSPDKSSRICKNHTMAMCGFLGNPNYDMYCTHCFSHLFPQDPRTAHIRKRGKEIRWVQALLQSPVLKPYEWNWDKPIYMSFSGGCCDSKRRIDLWTMIGNTILGIEIDEDQHKDRSPEDENHRYHDLMMDFTGHFTFLRINPDAFYTVRRPRKVHSELHTELHNQRIRHNPPFAERLKAVEAKLHSILRDITLARKEKALLTVHHMFYDNM